jgi:hypothetical protein
MKKDTNQKSNILRQKAELLLIKRNSILKFPETEIEIIRLLNELEVYEIELEMQNEELILAKEKAVIDAQKYSN